MKVQCVTCKFFCTGDKMPFEYGRPGYGTCRRMPPTIIGKNIDEYDSAFDSWKGHWPIVCQVDFCGEYEIDDKYKSLTQGDSND